MSYKILLTSTSFQDTPGQHHTLLDNYNFNIDRLRGPIKEEALLEVIQNYDGVICGDDDYTEKVILKGAEGKLKVISKYGIGLDRINLEAAKKYHIPVTNCPGVNQVTVAEHVFALLLSSIKNIIPEYLYMKDQKWVRLIGTELFGKTIGILGLGNVGKEVAIRANAFGLKVLAFDKYIDIQFSEKYNVTYINNIEEIIANCDIISLNMSLDERTRNTISLSNINQLKSGVIIVNTARAGLVDQNAILQGLQTKKIGAYLTDVLDEEPIVKDHPLLNFNNVIITPHIGSRTYENVEKQGIMAVENLIKILVNK